MKVNPSFLIKILAPMQAVIPKRHTLPICECLKMDSTGFTGTNLEQWIHIPYKNLPEVCINFQEFMETLKTLGNQIVEMQVEKIPVAGEVNSDSEGNLSTCYTYKITFIAGEMTMTSFGENNSDFPEVHEFIPEFKTTIPDLTSFVPFASTDELKPAMNGIFVGKDICSTDAHRLKVEPNQYHKEGNLDFVIPAKVVPKILNATRTIEVNSDCSRAKVHLDFGFFYTRLMCDKFPSYRNVLPEKTNTFVTINRNGIIKALEACLKYTNKTVPMVKFMLTEDKLSLFAEDMDYSKEFTTTVPCEWTGENGFLIGLNAKFLIQVLKDSKSPEVTLNLSTPNRAAWVDDNFIVMPIMIKETV
jgi:DNA polymerase III sliding clamp (beta) subunit (PCNA family)